MGLTVIFHDGELTHTELGYGLTFDDETLYVSIYSPAELGWQNKGIFQYWSENIDGTGKKYYLEDNEITSGAYEDKTINLYAIWGPVGIARRYMVKDTTGYTIYVQAISATSVSKVQFPTWTEANGQDDIQPSWGTNAAASGTAGSYLINGQSYNYKYRVNYSDHNNETGSFRTDIYVYDSAGNSQGYGWGTTR